MEEWIGALLIISVVLLVLAVRLDLDVERLKCHRRRRPRRSGKGGKDNKSGGGRGRERRQNRFPVAPPRTLHGGMRASEETEPMVRLDFNMSRFQEEKPLNYGKYVFTITSLQVDYTEFDEKNKVWKVSKWGVHEPGSLTMKTNFDSVIIVTIWFTKIDATYSGKKIDGSERYDTSQYFTTARQLYARFGQPLEGNTGLEVEWRFSLQHQNLEPLYYRPITF